MDFDAINTRVTENIRSLIEEIGSNPSRLAKAAGLGHTSIRDILAGTSGSPRYETLMKIANAAGVDVRRLTVGPNFQDQDAKDTELLDLLQQLEPTERQFLLNAAKAQIDARNRSSLASDEEPQ
ncbi:XRE family transcriptional regulator [Pseudophaeobacter sp.]|uniref:helix-turn-helix domain-containing protein n=1 Tax=Pseudophaeobacter sp. TaxID=1971739 RepID=UPI0032999D72